MTPHPELFEGNSDLSHLRRYDPKLVEALRRWSRRIDHPVYGIPNRQPPVKPTESDHIIAQLCRSVNLCGEIELRPRYYFSPGEKERFASYRDAVLVQSTCLNAKHTLPAKNWPADRMQRVVNFLRQTHRVVQIGHPSDTLLEHVSDARGKFSLRETAAIVGNALFFVGLVGFLMHLARAVNTRSVIVYGGREHPLQSGYTANENLYREERCSPCGIEADCEIGHPCMQAITPSDVKDAIERLQNRLASPLEVAKVLL